MCLCRSNALSAQQYNDICRMIEEEDVQLSRVFRKYETTKDVMHLVQDLQVLDRTLARQASATSSAAVASSTQDEDDDDTEDDEDDVDQQAESVEDDDDEEYNGRDSNAVAGDEDGETLNDDDAQLIERRFMQIIQNMALSELEQTALRLAIAENDPAIRNAIDAFRRDLNEERLVLAMRTAARAVIHRTLSSASRAEDDEEDDEENNGSGEDDDDDDNEEDNGDDGEDEEGDDEDAEESQDDDDDDDDDEDGDEPDYQDDDIKELLQLNRALYQNNAQLAQSNLPADDDEDAEDDEDDEDYDNGDDEEQDDEDDDGLDGHGVSLITSKSARDHVFPILVQELVKENIISRQDGGIIMKQFADNNPIVSTALDLYDTNNDMAKLVEALQQMVDNIRDESS